MKKYSIYSVLFLFVILISCSPIQESMAELIRDRLERSVQQYYLMAESLIDCPDQLPQTVDESGNLVTSSPAWWGSGFVPGTLWYLYEYSNEPELLRYARNYTARIENEKYNTGTHDLGFMLYCSFGNGYRITGDECYKETLLTGAESLSTRYNPAVGSIRSWDFNEEIWQYPVIIDNMMNLEFLIWCSKTSGNPKYYDISISHANNTLRDFFREDYSTYHVVSYDTIAGGVEVKNTFQGYAHESAWARGQAWTLYGYTFMYRETKNPAYLEQAKHVADFLLNHPNLPEDKIPYWDYDAPDIPHAKRDASAAAIMASGLIELSGYVQPELRKSYLEVAGKQLRVLSSPEYFAEKGTNGNFILKHSVGHLPSNSEIDVPLTYADYYYIEALLRYQNLSAESKN